MAWIEVHQELREHRKTYACAEMLNISRVAMVGTLVSLWLWALDNAPDGSLAGVSNRTIARVCDWPEKRAGVLLDALVACGWLDREGMRIHDWTDYVGRLMDRRAKDAERKRRLREAEKARDKISEGCPADILEAPKGCPPDVRGTSDGQLPDVQGKSAPTVPIPYPNRTVPIPYPNRTVPKDNEGERAEQRESADKPPARPRFTPPTLEEVRAYCQEAGYPGVDPGRFVDYYQSNGWKVGKNPMRDWRAAVRGWSSRDKPQRGSGGYESGVDRLARLYEEEFGK